MARNTFDLNLYTAIDWWGRICENNEVPANQQLAMFHLIRKINGEYWTPAQVSISKLANLMNVTRKTCQAAVDALIASNWLVKSEVGYFIRINGKTPKIESHEVLKGVDNENRNSTVEHSRNGERQVYQLGGDSQNRFAELQQQLAELSLRRIK